MLIYVSMVASKNMLMFISKYVMYVNVFNFQRNDIEISKHVIVENVDLVIYYNNININ